MTLRCRRSRLRIALSSRVVASWQSLRRLRWLNNLISKMLTVARMPSCSQNPWYWTRCQWSVYRPSSRRAGMSNHRERACSSSQSIKNSRRTWGQDHIQGPATAMKGRVRTIPRGAARRISALIIEISMEEKVMKTLWPQIAFKCTSPKAWARRSWLGRNFKEATSLPFKMIDHTGTQDLPREATQWLLSKTQVLRSKARTLSMTRRKNKKLFRTRLSQTSSMFPAWVWSFLSPKDSKKRSESNSNTNYSITTSHHWMKDLPNSRLRFKTRRSSWTFRRECVTIRLAFRSTWALRILSR